MPNAKVAVIVLHWNNYADTRDCLESLRDATYTDLMMVVVDNSSTNDSVDRLRAEFPQAHFVMNPANYGFAKGNNEGIRYALEHDADYVLLLNNDTIVSPDFLEPLVRTAASADRVGAISGTIYDYDRETGPTRRIYYAGAELSRWRGMGIIARYGQIDEEPEQSVTEVSHVSGCSMLIPRSVLDDIGLLDEQFYFGVEDADFCWRLLDSHYKLYYVPDSVLWHKRSGSRSFTPDEFYHGYISKCLLMYKHLPPLLWAGWYVIYAVRTLLFSGRIVAYLQRKHQLKSDQAQAMQQAIRRAIVAAGKGDFESPLKSY